MLASFIAIPFMIRYLGEVSYGVWATLLAIMSWIVFFDLGIGNGLRNRVAESLAKNNRSEAKDYIAVAYTLVGLGILLVYALVSIATSWIPWQKVFNTRLVAEGELAFAIRVASLFILLNFWVGLVIPLFGAFQKTSLAALGQLVSNLLILVFVTVLLSTGGASIVRLAFAYGVALLLANLLMSFVFFRKNADLIPRISFDSQYCSPLIGVGMQFFVIQLAVLVIFTTDRLLIIQLFGPSFVTGYDVAFKLFGIFTFIHMLVSAPLWSAYTDAYQRQDFEWLGSTLRGQLIFFAYIALAVLGLVFMAQPIFALWIGDAVTVSMSLVISLAAFVIVSMWNNVFAMFVNGIGKIGVQLATAVIAMTLNIPLSLLFVKEFGMGVHGIVIGTCVSLLLAAVCLPIQVKRLLRDASRD